MEILSASATKKQVELQLNGKSCIMNGIRRYLYEIIYNLCDNAIRYNKEGGKVTIDLEQKNNNTILSVADTGIGIPTEHQSRIFERFYRVDKSHSKETAAPVSDYLSLSMLLLITEEKSNWKVQLM